MQQIIIESAFHLLHPAHYRAILIEIPQIVNSGIQSFLINAFRNSIFVNSSHWKRFLFGESDTAGFQFRFIFSYQKSRLPDMADGLPSLLITALKNGQQVPYIKRMRDSIKLRCRLWEMFLQPKWTNVHILCGCVHWSMDSPTG